MEEKKYKFELTRSDIIKISNALKCLKRIFLEENVYTLMKLIQVFETLDKSMFDED